MTTISSKKKRDHDQLIDEVVSPVSGSPDTVGGALGGASSSSNFRNVSACNRCRQRKNRCDQKLPSCTACEKANVKCVGFDPVSKREIPRSYVYYLESRVGHLEDLLRSNNITFQPPEDFTLNIKPNAEELEQSQAFSPNTTSPKLTKQTHVGSTNIDPALKEHDDRLNNLVSNIGMVSVQGASDSRYLGSTSGISFARVVFAAVKSSVSTTPSERGGSKSTKALASNAATGGTTMRDSFFGLHTKPAIKPAPFPERDLGLKLVHLYFEHANPQIPILHRGEFMSLFERVYATDNKKRTARELYMLNIVFAIGSGIIMDSDTGKKERAEPVVADEKSSDDHPSRKKAKLSNQQHQPEEYHSSAIVHLESFLGSSPAAEGVSGGLEELQAVLLLAGLALLRPVAPGLWYIIGVAVRLGIDLGLHFEDNDEAKVKIEAGQQAAAERGRRQWTRDLRRRLWWCVYCFDRLVSTCVGRPFGITDQVVTTEFPCLLDDKYISMAGLSDEQSDWNEPSYKHVSHHYFRLRLLQSEILQVLQYRQAQQARASGANRGNQYMHTTLQSPFLQGFSSFRAWRTDVDQRLWEWKTSAPTQDMTGVQFTPLFLELNYWQAVIMLYRQSLSVPVPLAGELSPSTGEDVQSPGIVPFEDREDEQTVFLKVAEAGQKVLKIYRQLHRVRLVNYTFLATHHLFMSGISFLYAIWHSPTVRLQLTLDDVDFTVLAATSVLGDLIEKCPPAEACRDAFERMSKATITMCMNTTGFGNGSTSLSTRPPKIPEDYFDQTNFSMPKAKQRPIPKFDMNLKDLFSDDEMSRSSSRQMHQPRRESSSSSRNQLPDYIDTSSSSGTMLSLTSPQQQTTQQPLSYAVSNQQPYAPFAETISSIYPETDFSNLDFLDSFPISDPTNAPWDGGFANPELDLGFGTGGMGYDGAMDNGNIDLFDGFFFGNSGSGNVM